MKLERQFHTNENEDVARQRIADYLRAARYREESANPLVCTRGSRLGSAIGLTPKQWRVVATVNLTPVETGTDVIATLDIDTTGQWVIQRERRFWEQEMAGLVQAAGGQPEEAQPGMQEVVESRLKLENQFLGGANWFFIIAAFSLVNSVVALLTDGGWHFLVGLGVSQLVDAVALLLLEDAPDDMVVIVKALALLISLGISGVFALMGFLSRGRRKWSFAVGIGLYVLDMLLLVYFEDYASVLFHVIALYGLYQGFRVIDQLRATGAQPAGVTPA